MVKNLSSSEFYCPSQGSMWNRHFQRVCHELSDLMHGQHGCKLSVNISEQSNLYKNYLKLNIPELPEELNIFISDAQTLPLQEQNNLIEHVQSVLSSFLCHWLALENTNRECLPHVSVHESSLKQEIPPIVFSSKCCEQLERSAIDFSHLFNLQGFIHWKDLSINTDEDIHKLSDIVIYVSDLHLLSIKDQDLIARNLNKGQWVFGHLKSTPPIKNNRSFTEKDQENLSRHTLDIDNIPYFKKNIQAVIKMIINF